MEFSYSIYLISYLSLLMPAASQTRYSASSIFHDSLDRTHTQQLTSFGGVLNSWITDVLSNHTDTRHIVRFAIKYAKHRHPASFSTADYKIRVRNMNKLKLIYSVDGENPAMFGALDPILHHIVYVPLVWGLLYTFHLNVVTDKHLLPSIVHHFTVLEYGNSALYVFEHSFHHVTSSSQGSASPPTGSPIRRDLSLSGQSEPVEDGRRQGAVEMKTGCLSTAWNTMSQYTKVMLADYRGMPHLTSDQYCPVEDGSATPGHVSDRCESVAQSSQPDALLQSPQPFGQAGAGNCYLQGCTDAGDWSTHNKHGKRHLSILSYNIWNTNSVSGEDSDYIDRIQSLGKLCARIQADVITFQEVRFEDTRGGRLGPNQLDHLSDLLPQYQFVYQPAQVQQDGLPGLAIEGVAIFSRHPIIYRNAVLLSRNPTDLADGHQRVLMHAQVDIPLIGPVHVLSTHLSLSHEARLRSVLEIAEYLDTLQGPVFVSGDMNAEPHNEEIRFLSGKYTINGKRMFGFFDVWEYYHGNSNHSNKTGDSNKNNPRGLTFSTLDEKLSKRIDLIFFKDHPQLALSDVVLVDDGFRGDKAASDHLGILATFEIKSKSFM